MLMVKQPTAFVTSLLGFCECTDHRHNRGPIAVCLCLCNKMGCPWSLCPCYVGATKMVIPVAKWAGVCDFFNDTSWLRTGPWWLVAPVQLSRPSPNLPNRLRLASITAWAVFLWTRGVGCRKRQLYAVNHSLHTASSIRHGVLLCMRFSTLGHTVSIYTYRMTLIYCARTEYAPEYRYIITIQLST